jgi:hypothetical protein
MGRLILRRCEGNWIKIIHRSGDVLWLRHTEIRPEFGLTVEAHFCDDPKNFRILRGELLRVPPGAGAMPPE